MSFPPAKHGCRIEKAKHPRGVADAQPLGLLGLLRFPDQVPGDIDPHHISAAPRQLAGDAPVPARDIEDAQARDRSQQAQQGKRNRVVGRVETLDVQVSNSVIPGLHHASTVNRAHQPGAGHSSAGSQIPIAASNRQPPSREGFVRRALRRTQVATSAVGGNRCGGSVPQLSPADASRFSLRPRLDASAGCVEYQRRIDAGSCFAGGGCQSRTDEVQGLAWCPAGGARPDDASHEKFESPGVGPDPGNCDRGSLGPPKQQGAGGHDGRKFSFRRVPWASFLGHQSRACHPRAWCLAKAHDTSFGLHSARRNWRSRPSSTSPDPVNVCDQRTSVAGAAHLGGTRPFHGTGARPAVGRATRVRRAAGGGSRRASRRASPPLP